MFAVIKTGGKQYKVAAGDKIWIEKLDAKEGDSVSITDVLMLNDGSNHQVGAPLVDKAQVSLKVLDQTRNDTVIVFKKKRRQNYRRKNGHRQPQTVVMVEGISLAGKVLASADVSAVKAKVQPKSVVEEIKTSPKSAQKEVEPKVAAKPAKKETEKKESVKAPAKKASATKSTATKKKS